MAEKNLGNRNCRSSHQDTDLRRAVFGIDFRNIFQKSFLNKIKLRHVELKIVSTDVLKCDHGSHDFFAVVLLGGLKMKNRKKNNFLKFLKSYVE